MHATNIRAWRFGGWIILAYLSLVVSAAAQPTFATKSGTYGGGGGWNMEDTDWRGYNVTVFIQGEDCDGLLQGGDLKVWYRERVTYADGTTSLGSENRWNLTSANNYQVQLLFEHGPNKTESGNNVVKRELLANRVHNARDNYEPIYAVTYEEAVYEDDPNTNYGTAGDIEYLEGSADFQVGRGTANYTANFLLGITGGEHCEGVETIVELFVEDVGGNMVSEGTLTDGQAKTVTRVRCDLEQDNVTFDIRVEVLQLGHEDGSVEYEGTAYGVIFSKTEPITYPIDWVIDDCDIPQPDDDENGDDPDHGNPDDPRRDDKDEPEGPEIDPGTGEPGDGLPDTPGGSYGPRDFDVNPDNYNFQDPGRWNTKEEMGGIGPGDSDGDGENDQEAFEENFGELLDALGATADSMAGKASAWLDAVEVPSLGGSSHVYNMGSVDLGGQNLSLEIDISAWTSEVAFLRGVMVWSLHFVVCITGARWIWDSMGL